MDQNQKHTPGPWIADPAKHFWRVIRHTEGTRFRIIATTPDGTTGENEGNARLIAAAPNMFEALKRIAQFRCEDGFPSAEAEIAREAIAKATEK